MKTMLLIMTLCLSVTSFAKAKKGMIDIGNGETTIKITKGPKSGTTKQLAARILKLEKAVIDLQKEVYNLRSSSASTGEIEYTCTYNPFIGSPSEGVGAGSTDEIALNNAKLETVRDCKQKAPSYDQSECRIHKVQMQFYSL